MARRRGAILSDEWGLNPSGGTQQFPGPGGAIDQPTRSGRLSDLDLERQNRARTQAVRQEARNIPGRTRLTPQEEARYSFYPTGRRAAEVGRALRGRTVHPNYTQGGGLSDADKATIAQEAQAQFPGAVPEMFSAVKSVMKAGDALIPKQGTAMPEADPGVLMARLLMEAFKKRTEKRAEDAQINPWGIGDVGTGHPGDPSEARRGLDWN